MFELKTLTKEGIPTALEKAEKYRLLNDPSPAESICLDILEVDPENQKAIVILMLSITDQFGQGKSIEGKEARELLPRFKDEYKRMYYTGIIFERQANAILNQGIPGGKYDAYEWFRDAMDHYEKAEAIRPPGNDETILRWNTCARIIMNNNLERRQEDTFNPLLE